MLKLPKKPKHHHCIKQHDITDCGAACMATIARTHGLKYLDRWAGADTSYCINGYPAFNTISDTDRCFRRHLLLYLSQKIDITLILDYYQHVLDLPMRFFDTRKVGEILSRLSDASKIRNAISSATISVMIDTLLVIAGAFVFDRQLKDISEKINSLHIIAPIEGTIQILQEFNTGEYMPSGTEVLRIIPIVGSDFKVEMMIPNGDIARIEVGQTVHYRIGAGVGGGEQIY